MSEQPTRRFFFGQLAGCVSAFLIYRQIQKDAEGEYQHPPGQLLRRGPDDLVALCDRFVNARPFELSFYYSVLFNDFLHRHDAVLAENNYVSSSASPVTIMPTNLLEPTPASW